MNEHKIEARKLLREYAPRVFFISVFYIALITVLSELQFRLPGTATAYDRYLQRLSSGDLPGLGTIYNFFRPSGIPLAVILWLMSSIVNVGYMSYCLKTARRQPSEWKDLFDGFLFLGKALFIKLITIILVSLWSCLFIFPGIAAYYKYRQAYYLLLDDPSKSVIRCIRESKQFMRGKKLDLFLLDISFIGWMLLDFIVIILLPFPFMCPIVSIWVTPYRGLANASFYEQLVRKNAV